MKRQTVEADVVVAAPADEVFGCIADPATWPSWSAFSSGELERPGADGAFGVGAIRRMRSGRTTGREEVVVYEAPTRFSYVLLSGLPVRDYRGDVVLTPVDGGTRVTWHSTFLPKMPLTGWIWRRGLQRFVDEIVGALVASGARRPAGDSVGRDDG